MQLDKYLAELNKIELLEYQEEQELWKAYKAVSYTHLTLPTILLV